MYNKRNLTAKYNSNNFSFSLRVYGVLLYRQILKIYVGQVLTISNIHYHTCKTAKHLVNMIPLTGSERSLVTKFCTHLPHYSTTLRECTVASFCCIYIILDRKSKASNCSDGPEPERSCQRIRK